MDAKAVLQALISQLVDISEASSGLPDDRVRFAREAGQFNMVVRVASLAHPDWPETQARDYVAKEAADLLRERGTANH